MERCLKKLPKTEARLLRNYYLAATGNPMQVRKNLADGLGISANTLRQRVFLARQSLRACMTAVERKKR
jgi:DNA-directed RNA polymerase specialized sigma24 family protein